MEVTSPDDFFLFGTLIRRLKRLFLFLLSEESDRSWEDCLLGGRVVFSVVTGRVVESGVVGRDVLDLVVD